MLFIRTCNDVILNVEHIRSISIIGNRLMADMGEQNIVLYCNEDKKMLESALESVFKLFGKYPNSFDFNPRQ